MPVTGNFVCSKCQNQEAVNFNPREMVVLGIEEMVKETIARLVAPQPKSAIVEPSGKALAAVEATKATS